jgi:hypothetical protein
MSDIKSKVQEWLKDGKDYDDGITLLSRHSKKKSMVRFLSMNPNPSKADKLLYELLKMAGLEKAYYTHSEVIKKLHPEHKISGKVKTVVKKNRPAKKQIPAGTKVSEIKHTEPFNKLPLIVQEVIKQKGRLYAKREQLQEKLSNPKTMDNKPENVEARKLIGAKIERISLRIDELYEAEKSFKKTGAAIPETIMDWKENPEPENKNMPALNKLSDLELKNKQTNLKSYLTKENNQLRYQNKSAQKEENPMPAGPKRTKLEQKVKARKLEIDAIEQELKSRAGKSKGHKTK